MADLRHSMGGDLLLGVGGDLATVDDSDLVLQAISHRLLTGSGGYIWHPEYGAGLPGMVGSVVAAQQISAMILAQLAREVTVAAVPVPEVSVVFLGGNVTLATIKYVDATNGNAISQELVLET